MRLKKSFLNSRIADFQEHKSHNNFLRMYTIMMIQVLS